MRNYEGAFIIDPDLPADVVKSATAQLQELIKKNQGRVDALQEWGKRRLAYKIRKKNDGVYVIINFHMPSLEMKKFEQSLRLNDQIMRYLIVNKDEV